MYFVNYYPVFRSYDSIFGVEITYYAMEIIIERSQLYHRKNLFSQYYKYFYATGQLSHKVQGAK